AEAARGAEEALAEGGGVGVVREQARDAGGLGDPRRQRRHARPRQVRRVLDGAPVVIPVWRADADAEERAVLEARPGRVRERGGEAAGVVEVSRREGEAGGDATVAVHEAALDVGAAEVHAGDDGVARGP